MGVRIDFLLPSYYYYASGYIRKEAAENRRRLGWDEWQQGRAAKAQTPGRTTNAQTE